MGTMEKRMETTIVLGLYEKAFWLCQDGPVWFHKSGQALGAWVMWEEWKRKWKLPYNICCMYCTHFFRDLPKSPGCFVEKLRRSSSHTFLT